MGIGTVVENAACDFLQQRAVQIVQRNFRCKLGEIDIVALEQQMLVFVEVRFRKNSAYGSAAESIDWRKQQKIVRTAERFLQTNPAFNTHRCRFDVVAISNTIQAPHIEWIKDAFHA